MENLNRDDPLDGISSPVPTIWAFAILLALFVGGCVFVTGCHRHDRPKEKEIIHEVEREVVKPHRR